ncbi:UNVERIFIED_CONTAM: hypothetical protein GTU68_013503 [Idotea baltica]|nr:hypothetical protein [Idotea baltica]
MSRQIVLDTETTGLDPKTGHRVIEIGCVELRERRLTGNNLHLYLQPDREIDHQAIEIHGITNEFLIDKPRFQEIAVELKTYLTGAELLIHNAPFDVAFLESEFSIIGDDFALTNICSVTDTLAMARKMYPGQRNSLDALCKRLGVSNGHRTLHGALLDSEILSDVYLTMTGGQTALSLDADRGTSQNDKVKAEPINTDNLVVVRANESEMAAHEAWMAKLSG